VAAATSSTHQYVHTQYAAVGAELHWAVTGISDLLVRVPSDAATEVDVLANYGANDFVAGTSEASFKADYVMVIDAILAKRADARIFIAKPWRRGYDAAALTMAGWIDDLVALYPGQVFVGHNENVWLKGADDGATMTVDGTHYSEAGQVECKNQWLALVGS
jgi:hypothetical protein